MVTFEAKTLLLPPWAMYDVINVNYVLGRRVLKKKKKKARYPCRRPNQLGKNAKI